MTNFLNYSLIKPPTLNPLSITYIHQSTLNIFFFLLHYTTHKNYNKMNRRQNEKSTIFRLQPPPILLTDSIVMIYAYKYGKIRKRRFYYPKKIGSKLLKPYRKNINVYILSKLHIYVDVLCGITDNKCIFMYNILCAVSMARSSLLVLYGVYVFYRVSYI